MFNRLRIYHAALGALSLIAYVSEDWKSVHVWLGYSIIVVLCFRILSMPFPRMLPRPAWLLKRSDNLPKLGVRNPVISKAFITAIMASLLLTTATGIYLDQYRSEAQSGFFFSTAAQADERKPYAREKRSNKAIKEVHEFGANSLLALVSLHVVYLLLVRRQYALRMIFVDQGVHSPKKV